MPVGRSINSEIVMWDTWGHLAPEPHKKYYGWIIVAKAAFRNNFIFDYHFDELPDSPWFADDLCEFAFDVTKDKEGIGLWRYEGWYKKFKNGNYQFGAGKFVKLTVGDNQ